MSSGPPVAGPDVVREIQTHLDNLGALISSHVRTSLIWQLEPLVGSASPIEQLRRALNAASDPANMGGVAEILQQVSTGTPPLVVRFFRS